MYKYIYIFVGMAGVMARLPRVWGEADNLSIPSPRLPSDASVTVCVLLKTEKSRKRGPKG